MNDERKGCTSASNAEADALCGGRHLAQAGIPETRSEYAEHGRTVHAALALRDPRNLVAEALETYERCIDVESRKVSEFFGQDAPKEWSENPDDPVSSRFWVKFQHEGKVYEHSCRPDRFYWMPGGKMLIVEYKTLRGDVAESSRNLQLRDQQVILRGHYIIPGEIGVVVVQPWVNMNPEICVYTAEDSDRARREMFARVVASNDPSSERVAGEIQCKYCRAKKSCLAYTKWAGQMTPPALLTILDVPMSAWTPEQRARAADAIKPTLDFVDLLKDFFKEGFATDPNFVPGWTLVPGRQREAINDPQKCFERFTQIGGNLDQFMTCISVGKTKLKDAVKGVTGAKGKALDNAITALCDGIVKVSTDAPMLVRLSGDK